MKVEYIKSFAGPIIGTIETDGSGKRTAKKWAGPILGWYDPHSNYTYSVKANKQIAEGDITQALVWAEGRI